MRNLRLLFFSFLFSIAPYACFADGIADELPKMVGKNTGELLRDHSTTLRALTRTTNQNWLPPLPWHVWKFSAPAPRYVVFSGRHIETIPGNSSASILLVSARGAEIASWKFSTGWRSDIESANLSFDKTLETGLIAISTIPVTSGQNIAKQYFALEDDKLYFIRMEDSKGRLIRNYYLSPNLSLGGDLPAKDVTGWSSLLRSSKLPLRLAALTYLSGIHMNPDRAGTGVANENVEDAKCARAFRAADSTKEHIMEYSHSENRWLKEAADLAAAPAQENY